MPKKLILTCLLALLPVLALADEDGAATGTPPEGLLDPAAALAQARVAGKYRMLLHQIEVAEDAATYGDFRDWGPWQGTAYKDHADLDPGHWVYVRPYWYVWRDLVAEVGEKRAWGPEQATGAPDTPEPGDFETAWASKTPDDQDEWLLLEYESPVRPLAVIVYETFNPGALEKVSVFDLRGKEIVVWEGADPAVPGDAVAVLPIRVAFPVARVKLHLASKRVDGWNEIDAVGLLDTKGNTHWATAAHASSSYADPEFRLEITPTVKPMPFIDIELDPGVPIWIPPLSLQPPIVTPPLWPTPEVILYPPVVPVPAPVPADAEQLRQMQEALDRIQAELDALRARLEELASTPGR